MLAISPPPRSSQSLTEGGRDLQYDLWPRPGRPHHPHRHRRPHPGRHAPGGSPVASSQRPKGLDANAGAAGAIQVTAASLTLTEGARSPARPLAPAGAAPSPSPSPTPSPWPARARMAPPVASSPQAQGLDANAGAAGAIQVTAASLALTEGAVISSSTFGPGQGGTITLTVTEALTLAGTNACGLPQWHLRPGRRGLTPTRAQRAPSRSPPPRSPSRRAPDLQFDLWPGAGGPDHPHRHRRHHPGRHGT